MKDSKKLEAIHGKLPEDPAEQNRLWYSIYKKNEKDAIVASSHKDFLMLRDFATIAVILLVTGGLTIWFTPCITSIKCIYFGALTLQALILQVSARNYGIRFVTNVLAVETNGIQD